MQQLAVAFSIFIGCIVVVSAVEPAPAVIALQPLGDVQAERLSVVKQGLEKACSLKVETLPVKPLPKAVSSQRANHRFTSIGLVRLTGVGSNGRRMLPRRRG